MKHNKVTIRYLASLLCMVFALLLALELSFRFLIPACESPYYFYDREHKILRFDNSKSLQGLYTFGNLSEIRANWHVNKAGWLSDVDYEPHTGKPVLAIIGNSYVEALQVPPKMNLTAHLRDRLRDCYEVQSFAVSGAPLSQFLQMSRYARATVHPRVMIFCLTADTIKESLRKEKPGFLYFTLDGTEVKEGELPFTASTIVMQSYRKSALLRYLKLNNGFIVSRREFPTAGGGTADQDNGESRKILSYAFSAIRAENPDTEIMMVLDAPRQEIYHGGSLAKAEATRNLVKLEAEYQGMHFVDLTSGMCRLYSLNHRMFNYDINFHWNGYGHEVVAGEIYKELLRLRLVIEPHATAPCLGSP